MNACFVSAIEDVVKQTSKDIVYVFIDGLQILVDVMEAEIATKIDISTLGYKLVGQETDIEKAVHNQIANQIQKIAGVMNILPINNFRDCPEITNMYSLISYELDNALAITELLNTVTDRNKVAQYIDSSLQSSEQELVNLLKGYISDLRVIVQEM
jgi:hypothetical protein